jgi:DNA-binding response OmpR family regulator
LSAKEATVLRVLLERVGRVITRSQLVEALYGWGKSVESNAIEVHIHNLRHKLGSETVKTVRGIGYTVPKSST